MHWSTAKNLFRFSANQELPMKPHQGFNWPDEMLGTVNEISADLLRNMSLVTNHPSAIAELCPAVGRSPGERERERVEGKVEYYTLAPGT